MSRLKYYNTEKNQWEYVDTSKTKSLYQYAVDAGFNGTEEDFSKKLFSDGCFIINLSERAGSATADTTFNEIETAIASGEVVCVKYNDIGDFSDGITEILCLIEHKINEFIVFGNESIKATLTYDSENNAETWVVDDSDGLIVLINGVAFTTFDDVFEDIMDNLKPTYVLDLISDNEGFMSIESGLLECINTAQNKDDGTLTEDEIIFANSKYKWICKKESDGSTTWNREENTLSIANGGTGATTAEQALTNLNAAPLNHTHTLESVGISYGTEDLEAGVSPLETGKIYFVYKKQD